MLQGARAGRTQKKRLGMDGFQAVAGMETAFNVGNGNPGQHKHA